MIGFSLPRIPLLLFIFLAIILLFGGYAFPQTPRSPLLDEGVRLMDAGKLEDARKRFEAVVSQDPASYPGRYYLGEVLLRLRKYREAEAEFNEALRLNPSSQSARFELGLIAEAEGLWDKAFRLHREVIEKAPGRPEAAASRARLLPWGETQEAFRGSHDHFAAAEAFIRGKKLDEAAVEFEKVIELAPLNSQALQFLGQIYLQAKKTARAIEILERYIKLNPNAITVLYPLATLYEEKEEFAKAIAAYKRVVEKGGKSREADSARKKLAIMGDDPEAARSGRDLYALGREQLKEGQIVQALETFQKLLKILPGNSGAHMFVAQIYLRQGKEDEAINEYKKIHAVEPTHYPSHNALGFLYLNRGLLDEAKAELEIVVREAPDEDLVQTAKKYLALIESEGDKVKTGKEAREHLARATELSRAERFPEAIRELQAAISLQPENHFFHHNLGLVYFNNGQADKAFFEFNKAVELRDDYLPSHFLLALFYQATHLYKLAIKQFEKVISLSKGGEFQVEEAKKQIGVLEKQFRDEQVAAGHAILGTVLVSQNDLVRGRVQYEQALVFDPNNATNHYNLALLEELEGYSDFAEAGFYDAIDNDPTFALAYYHLGSIRQKEGKLDEARDLYLRTLDEKPDHVLSQVALGEIFENQQLFLPARERFHIVLDLDPEDRFQLRSAIERRLNFYEKPYSLSLGYSMLSYDSNFNASSRPVPDYSTGFSASLNYYPYKTRTLSVPLSFDTSQTFYVQSQIFVGQITMGPTLFLSLADYTLSFSYRYNYVQTNRGPSSRNSDLQGSVSWSPGFARGSLINTLFPSSVSLSYRYRDSFSFDSFLLDAKQQTYSVSMIKGLPFPYGVFSLSYSYFDGQVVDPSQARTQQTVGVGYFKTLSPKLRMSLSYSQTRTSLKIPNFFTRQIEKHHLTSFGAGLAYDLTPTFHYNFNLSNDVSGSNLNAAFAGVRDPTALASGQAASLVDYRRTRITLSFSFDF